MVNRVTVSSTHLIAAPTLSDKMWSTNPWPTSTLWLLITKWEQYLTWTNHYLLCTYPSLWSSFSSFSIVSFIHLMYVWCLFFLIAHLSFFPTFPCYQRILTLLRHHFVILLVSQLWPYLRCMPLCVTPSTPTPPFALMSWDLAPLIRLPVSSRPAFF